MSNIGSTPPGSAPTSPSEPERIAKKSSTGVMVAVAVIVVLLVAGIGYAAYAGLFNSSKPGTGSNCTLPASTTLLGAGSTFVQPLMSQWTSVYTASSVTYNGIGSGAGIQGVSSKTLDFGATDAPLTPSQAAAAPGMLHIPESAGAIAIIYNVPGAVGPINFTGDVLAKIYLGVVTNWNDSSLTSLTPNGKLPNQAIAVVHRSDGSGTTYAYSDFLAKDNATWKTTVGVATSLNWPVGIGAKGSSGVAGTVQTTPYSVGYVDLTYALNKGVSFGAIKNPAGFFVLPSLTSAGAAIASVNPSSLPSGSGNWSAVSLNNEPGNVSYPITTFTYLLVYQDVGRAYGSSYTQTKAENLVDFLSWVVGSKGQSYSATLYYVPLPSSIVQLDLTTIASMQFNGQAIPSCVPN